MYAEKNTLKHPKVLGQREHLILGSREPSEEDCTGSPEVLTAGLSSKNGVGEAELRFLKLQYFPLDRIARDEAIGKDPEGFVLCDATTALSSNDGRAVTALRRFPAQLVEGLLDRSIPPWKCY